MADSLRLEFFGRDADAHELDLYDAGRSIEGLGRTVAILAHYYQTGKIIHQAPSAAPRISLRAPQQGSFIFDVGVNAVGAIVGGIVLVPITFWLTQIMGQWLPGGTAADRARVQRLENRLAAQEARADGLEAALARRDQIAHIEGDVAAVKRYIADHRNELDVLRSITSNSFVDIFRPIGRSADFVAMYGEPRGAYVGVVDAAAVQQIQAEMRDDDVSIVSAVVSSFSRSSKSGVAFSSGLGRGFRFHYGSSGKLDPEDDFSWSQFTQKPIVMEGVFYRFFDGSVKRLEVFNVERS